MKDDLLQTLSSTERQRVGNVLYQGAVARIRFQNNGKSKSSYQRLFPLSDIVKKRITSDGNNNESNHSH